MPRQRVLLQRSLFLWGSSCKASGFGRTSERFRRVLGFALVIAILASLVLAAADLTVGQPGVTARKLLVWSTCQRA